MEDTDIRKASTANLWNNLLYSLLFYFCVPFYPVTRVLSIWEIIVILIMTIHFVVLQSREIMCIPVEPELQNVDSKHGLATEIKVLLFVFLRHVHLVFLIPSLFLLQFCCLLSQIIRKEISKYWIISSTFADLKEWVGGMILI